MKSEISKLRQIIREAVQDYDYKGRWPRIEHFDTENEEDMMHPGNWKVPSMDDFMRALSQMHPDHVERMVDDAFHVLDMDKTHWSKAKQDYIPIDWTRSNKVKRQMFDTWARKEAYVHRNEQNVYFASSRRRDSEAREKAMQDPEATRMGALVRSRDGALDRGEPWFPDE